MENMENVENIEVVNCFNTEKRSNGGLESSRNSNGFAEAILKTITAVVKNYLNAEKRSNGGLESSRDNNGFAEAILKTITAVMNNYLNAEEQRSRGAVTLQNSVTPFLCVKNKITAWYSCFEWGCLRQFSFRALQVSVSPFLCVKNKIIAWYSCFEWGCLRQFSFRALQVSVSPFLCVKKPATLEWLATGFWLGGPKVSLSTTASVSGKAGFRVAALPRFRGKTNTPSKTKGIKP